MKRQDEIRALKKELEMYPAVPGSHLKRMKLLRRLHQLKFDAAIGIHLFDRGGGSTKGPIGSEKERTCASRS
jgi:hypothetical protein